MLGSDNPSKNPSLYALVTNKLVLDTELTSLSVNTSFFFMDIKSCTLPILLSCPVSKTRGYSQSLASVLRSLFSIAKIIAPAAARADLSRFGSFSESVIFLILTFLDELQRTYCFKRPCKNPCLMPS